MLNLTGAFVVIGSKEPTAVILSETAYQLFMDRIAVVGFEKATSYTFGHTATHALPCTLECMEAIALNYVGPYADQVKQLCARIALKQPIGNGKDIGEGGQHARIDAPVPNPKSPAGVAKRVRQSAQVQS